MKPSLFRHASRCWSRARPLGQTLILIALCSGCRDREAPSLSKLQPASPAPEPEQVQTTLLPPPVTLDGVSAAGSVTLLAPGTKRVYSISERAWIHAKPDPEAPKLGYLRAGSSAPSNGEMAGDHKCKGGWYSILPRGYVCLGANATFDAKHPIVQATEAFAPDLSRKLPYLYGTVRKPGPIYARLPNGEEVRRAEPGYEKRMQEWLTAPGEIGASYAQHVWLAPGESPTPAQDFSAGTSAGVPAYLRDGAEIPNLLRTPREPGQLVIQRMEPKVGYSFLETFLWQGRRYGVSAELKILPTDRLRPIQGSDFHGYRIGKDIDFPFAIVRRVGARFRDGSLATYRSALKLTGKQQFFGGVLHYETLDKKWIADRDASRLDPAKKMPAWGKNGEKWIDVSLNKQVLVLYEGSDPVFATLISSGEAGLEDPEHTTATKRGIFRIHTKHITNTMASNVVGEEFELQDVPYVQYFDDTGGYALHGAYWHDRFGMPKSHGCLNLSPEDARRIFFWTEPQVPAGWHSALDPLKGTVIFIHP